MFNFFVRCFSLFVFGCVFLSKTDCRVLCFLEFLVFQLVLKKLESWFHKNN